MNWFHLLVQYAIKVLVPHWFSIVCAEFYICFIGTTFSLNALWTILVRYKNINSHYVEPNKMFIGECVWAPRGGTMSCETVQWVNFGTSKNCKESKILMINEVSMGSEAARQASIQQTMLILFG